MMNHLALHDGKLSIVVLDEVEKTSDETRNALLRIIECGEYIQYRYFASISEFSKFFSELPGPLCL